jgi:pyruvate/2-oxoglutarate dehydrogenase complex dihydrolipoamide dehydrogenase (E3) component
MDNEHATMTLAPLDSHNKTLIANTHPPRWANPRPLTRYNLVVIGAGTAGLVTAAGAAGLGAKVALVERGYMGGDCLNAGCVPSKAVIRSSRTAAEIMGAERFGIRVPAGTRADFGAVMERMRRLRSGISIHDSAKRFSEELGVHVFFGEGKFAGPSSIEVDGAILRFKKAVIATGARPVVPPIEGLAESGYLTNESIFNLTERPDHLVVVGGGPIGCELAQAFRRLGSRVTVIEMAPQFLIREDPEAADILARAFRTEGIDILLGTGVKKITTERGKTLVHVQKEGTSSVIRGDALLMGVGRAPETKGLNLEAAGVAYDRTGVIVNDLLQTTNTNIYAAGDVAMMYKFTHTADAAARIVIQNALFLGRKRLSSLTVPWTTYTDPEIAHVGMYERDAHERGIAVETFQRDFSDVDRPVLDGQEDGFVKVHVKKGTDRILGATIVAAHAGEMISEITLAIVSGIGLGRIASVIHPYPTQAEAVRQLGDAYNRTRLTPAVKRAFEWWLKWTR